MQKLIPLLVIAASLSAYQNSFEGVFLLDDWGSVVRNPTIHRLWPVWQALSPPRGSGTTVAGRPMINWSFAVNYAIGGTRVLGYHVLNLAIHTLAGLTLLGIVRRTLLQEPLRQRFGAAAQPLALAIAIIWVVHPLQTESVAYVSQRAESLMGLFYLLTLYCAIRGAETDSSNAWYVLSVASCLLGVASKEVIGSAPLLVFLYDRTFLSGSFREAWRRRWRLYVALAATWIPLSYLVISAGNRGGSAGFGAGVTWQAYALTQFQAIAHYVRLSVWPHPLVFDYGIGVASSVGEVVPCALAVIALLISTAIALWRWPAVGFLGAWFFGILIPTSSVLPVATQTIAEHRMYLSLVALIAIVVLGAFEIGKRIFSGQQGRVLGCAAGGLVVVLLTIQTVHRNQDYNSEVALWRDTVMKCPNNPRAHYNLGVALGRLGKFTEEIGQYEQALRINPDYADAHYNLGVALGQAGKLQEATGHFNEALRIAPDFAEAHNNLGVVLIQMGRVQEAIDQWEQALQIQPDNAEAQDNLGNAFAQVGKLDNAIRHYEQAVRLQPDYAIAYYNLGGALARLGRVQEAIERYQQALRLKPDFVEAQDRLARLQPRRTSGQR
jgi:Flp pilus assembly protein TadD